MTKKVVHTKLNQWFATAICGNDILSSALYVSGISILFAGIYAPIVLVLIGVILFLYKKVYTEVVETLPINGGAYNCLLNGTSKTLAATAGVATILSYVATAVISAKVGIEYLHAMLHFIPVVAGTIILLFIFALLVISGIKDSAKVALAIFCFHIIVLLTFLGFGLYFYLSGNSYFSYNMLQTNLLTVKSGGITIALFLSFSASLLGVSGFESSANFVEEQEKGVFRKTLRNMLIGVSFFNPLIALVVLNSMPYETIVAAKDFLLADAATQIGGKMLFNLVVIDAFLVLSGAVLTSYVGVTGLINRMAGDGCLPNVLNKENSKGSFPRIILTFFLLCVSILILTKGNLLSLAGVYTIAFLSVMSLFALGNFILKGTRPDLKRSYKAPVIVVFLAFSATFVGIVGNIIINHENLTYFAMYFLPSMALVLVMIYIDYLTNFAIRVSAPLPWVQSYFKNHFDDLRNGKFIVFIRNTHRIHEILSYINKNETGWNIYFVKCKDSEPGGSSLEEIEKTVDYIQKAGVYPEFSITVKYVNEEFGPDVINKVSRYLRVRKNRILIGSIHHHHAFDYADLGGVRIIF